MLKRQNHKIKSQIQIAPQLKINRLMQRKEERQRIRNDRLPTTTDVIRSDLDARDLYRNQVQTSLDDAIAEFVYQKKESGDDVQKFDPTELLDILKLAQTSVDKWFGFIPDQDVKAALDAVQREQA